MELDQRAEMHTIKPWRAFFPIIDSSAVETSFEKIPFANRGVGLDAMAAGPKDGPVAVLLHGFPEFWYGWRKQIEPLAKAGFRVIVPDQRGYNVSSKPRGVASYALTELVSDVIAMADELGQKQILLAGHDWGAAVAWGAALLHPKRIAKLAVVNVPHPSVMRRFLTTQPRQILRSWYIFFFQIPWLAHLFCRRSCAIPCRLVATWRPRLDDQLVSRGPALSRAFRRPHRARAHAHPVGRA